MLTREVGMRHGDPGDVATELAHMARELLACETVQATLDLIVRRAVELVDGCEAAGVLEVRQGRVRPQAATDNVVHASARIQQELGEGPCLDAAYHEEPVFRLADPATSRSRWPRYAPRARELGVGSMMGFLLFTEGMHNLGALNLYSSRHNVFTQRSEHVGWLFASHASVAYASARTDAQLREALRTRTEIGQALGIIMERYKVPENEAFAVLTKISQDTNTKVSRLARTINETGAVPGRH